MNPETQNKAAEKKTQKDVQNNNQKTWTLKEKEMEAMKSTANKYAVLGSLDKEDRIELNMLKDRTIVDKYLNMRLQPSLQVKKTWSADMIKYFNEKWEEERLKEGEANKEQIEEVIENENTSNSGWIGNEVNGTDAAILN